MSSLTKTEKKDVEHRVVEKYQQILEKLVIGNRENGEQDEYKISEKHAAIVLSEFYCKIWARRHCTAMLALENKWRSDREEKAWHACAKSRYARYIVNTKYRGWRNATPT